MKNKYILGALLISITSLFTACTDDNDSNPTLIQPTEFVLNTPAYANETVDLQNSSEIALSWSQPKYTAENAPVNATYEVQLSPTNSFTISKAEADEDESGETVADYFAFSKTTTLCNISFTCEEIDKNLIKLLGWTEDATPELQDVYMRVVSFIAEDTKRLNPIVSNTIKLSLKPYYTVVKDADPELWYLLGGCIADGSWGETAAKIGFGNIPMCPIKGAKYDAKTGQGNLTYTGYFVAAQGFKIIKNNKWDDFEWGGVGHDINKPVMKGHGTTGDDFNVPADGYYTITLTNEPNDEAYANTSLSIVPAEKDPVEYAEMSVAGSFNGWADEAMEPVDTWAGAKPHVWRLKKTFDTDAELKFKMTGSWDSNWGATGFPYGWGVNNGANIPVKAGTYLILFNDITGYYHFYERNND